MKDLFKTKYYEKKKNNRIEFFKNLIKIVTWATCFKNARLITSDNPKVKNHKDLLKLDNDSNEWDETIQKETDCFGNFNREDQLRYIGYSLQNYHNLLYNKKLDHIEYNSTKEEIEEVIIAIIQRIVEMMQNHNTKSQNRFFKNQSLSLQIKDATDVLWNSFDSNFSSEQTGLIEKLNNKIENSIDKIRYIMNHPHESLENKVDALIRAVHALQNKTSIEPHLNNTEIANTSRTTNRSTLTIDEICNNVEKLNAFLYAKKNSENTVNSESKQRTDNKNYSKQNADTNIDNSKDNTFKKINIVNINPIHTSDIDQIRAECEKLYIYNQYKEGLQKATPNRNKEDEYHGSNGNKEDNNTDTFSDSNKGYQSIIHSDYSLSDYQNLDFNSITAPIFDHMFTQLS